MNCRFVPYSNHKRDATRVCIAGCSYGFSERVSQEEISRIRFNRDMPVSMLCFQLRLQAIGVDLSRVLGDALAFLGYHCILHWRL